MIQVRLFLRSILLSVIVVSRKKYLQKQLTENKIHLGLLKVMFVLLMLKPSESFIPHDTVINNIIGIAKLDRHDSNTY